MPLVPQVSISIAKINLVHREISSRELTPSETGDRSTNITIYNESVSMPNIQGKEKKEKKKNREENAPNSVPANLL
jgi:hypothetical protein